jgi:hypothetical protein
LRTRKRETRTLALFRTAGLQHLTSSTQRVDHVKLDVANPLAGVRVVGLGPEVEDAIPHCVRQRTRGTVRNDRADQIAVVAVEYDFIAELGTIAGLDEAASGRHRGVPGLMVDGSRRRHERPDSFPCAKGDEGPMGFAVEAVTR